ncbi:MAG: serine protein kinase RIO [Candidatus Nitrosopelagicus sp.]|nr:serine protein kinase RIO [Candidatus Nitrosopelagicus sp.]
MKTFSDETDDLDFFLNSKNFLKSKKKILPDGFKKNKTVNEVLDKLTTLTLFNLIKSKTIAYVNGVVRAGKESVVFWAVSPDNNDIALKVYLVTTSSFKKRATYILGDPRFSRIKKGTRNLVYLWAKKEHQNLTRCVRNSIPVVKPITVKNNVLALEFVGKDGIPEKTLIESEVNGDDYKSAIRLIKQLYKKARLVHGDFSEYNIFKTENGLVLFDLGSAVDLEHPKAHEFLKRDIENISNFFVRRGLTVKNPIDIINEVTK